MSLSRKNFLKTIGLGALAAGSRAYGLASPKLEETKAAAKKLKIKDVEVYYFDLPLVAPFRISIGEQSAANDLLIRVVTDQGIVGIGEACPFPPITGWTWASSPSAAARRKPSPTFKAGATSPTARL